MGNGLTEQSANDMGLIPGTAIATSLIDAHAGGIGRLSTALFISPDIGYIPRHAGSGSGESRRSVVLSCDISTGNDWWNLHMPHGRESPLQ